MVVYSSLSKFSLLITNERVKIVACRLRVSCDLNLTFVVITYFAVYVFYDPSTFQGLFISSR